MANSRRRRRAAVVFRGAHTHEKTDYGREWGPDDWRRCFRSLNSTYIQRRKQHGWQVDIFYHTHHSAESGELREVLQPLNFSEAPVSQSFTTQWQSALHALQTLSDPSQYDEIMWTRFDVLHKANVDDWNLRADHFNVPFRHPNNGLCDVFFVFNASFVAPLVRLLPTVPFFSLHEVDLAKKMRPLHVMLSRKRYVSEASPILGHLDKDAVNPLYVLLRTKRWGLSDAVLRERHQQEHSPYWLGWRVVRLVQARGGAFVIPFVIFAFVCACVGIRWHLRRSGRARTVWVPLPILLANCVWLALPAYFIFQSFRKELLCEDIWCISHG